MRIKKISMDTLRIDGENVSLIAAFRKRAEQENWDREEIDTICNEALSKNVKHMMATLEKHCERFKTHS